MKAVETVAYYTFLLVCHQDNHMRLHVFSPSIAHSLAPHCVYLPVDATPTVCSQVSAPIHACIIDQLLQEVHCVSCHHVAQQHLLRQLLTMAPCVQVMKGLRGGVQNVALKMLIGETAHNVNSFRQVRNCLYRFAIAF